MQLGIIKIKYNRTSTHFMDNSFVNLGEEAILTLLWQSGVSESATVCFVISLSICYWLQMQSFARCVGARGWTTYNYLKSTFVRWKSSRSWLVAYEILNEQLSLELWQTLCAQLWNMTQHWPHRYCIYNSLFWSVLSSLGRYISHRFLHFQSMN